MDNRLDIKTLTIVHVKEARFLNSVLGYTNNQLFT